MSYLLNQNLAALDLNLRNNQGVRGSNHTGMRQFNERIVLQAIRQNGSIPKADLSRLTQLSSQTIAIIVDRLIEDGLLIKHARIRGKIGQPSVPIALNPDGAFGVGVQIGRRGLEMIVTDFVGNTRFSWGYRYDYPEPESVMLHIKEGLLHLERVMGASWAKVVGIGLTAPLSLHQWADVLAKPNKQIEQALACWEHINILQAVQAMTPLPVEFAKDTIAACVAELLKGQGQKSAHFLYIYMGTFVGGGLVMGGHIINGPRGNAGSIGSMPMGLSPRPIGKTSKEFGVPLQLLEVASGWQLEQALIDAHLNPLLVHSDTITEAQYRSVTQVWLDQSANALALTIATASSLLDLDAIVIDGSISNAMVDLLIIQTQSKLNEYAFKGMHTPQVLKGEVGVHARAIGGSLLPLHTQFFPDKEIFLKNDL